MKTIAQELKVTEFPFIIKDKNNNQIYCEYSDGYWWKLEYDSNNNEIYCEYSDGYWSKREFDSNCNIIYFENSDGKIIDKSEGLLWANILKKMEDQVDKINIITKKWEETCLQLKDYTRAEARLSDIKKS